MMYRQTPGQYGQRSGNATGEHFRPSPYGDPLSSNQFSPHKRSGGYQSPSTYRNSPKQTYQSTYQPPYSAEQGPTYQSAFQSSFNKQSQYPPPPSPSRQGLHRFGGPQPQGYGSELDSKPYRSVSNHQFDAAPPGLPPSTPNAYRGDRQQQAYSKSPPYGQRNQPRYGSAIGGFPAQPSSPYNSNTRVKTDYGSRSPLVGDRYGGKFESKIPGGYGNPYTGPSSSSFIGSSIPLQRNQSFGQNQQPRQGGMYMPPDPRVGSYGSSRTGLRPGPGDRAEYGSSIAGSRQGYSRGEFEGGIQGGDRVPYGSQYRSQFSGPPKPDYSGVQGSRPSPYGQMRGGPVGGRPGYPEPKGDLQGGRGERRGMDAGRGIQARGGFSKPGANFDRFKY